MIPLQDVVPSGRPPITTLALIGVNVAVFVAQSLGPGVTGHVPAPFVHGGPGPFFIGLLFLWLFGDNVEARVGRVAFLLMYLGAGWLSGLGSAGAITAVMGAYFMLLPRSRVLVLVPFPVSLVEVPAAFFLGVWVVLHLLAFVMQPSTLWAFGLALVIGAAIARVRARPITW